MAARAINHNNVFHGRAQQLTVNKDSVESIALQSLKDGVIDVNEEIKETDYECADATEINEDHGRKVVAELVYDEVVTADITAITDSDELIVTTSSGGANGTGQTFTMSDCDSIKAFVSNLKTKVVAKKTTTSGTLGYVIADNAA